MKSRDKASNGYDHYGGYILYLMAAKIILPTKILWFLRPQNKIGHD